MISRVGIGYDIHRLTKGKPLIIGGVNIPHAKGTVAHSDGDALLHALCDALLGALGERDMGYFFPDTDPRFKNKPSSFFIAETMKLVKKKKLRVLSADAIVVLEKPKLQPFMENILKEVKKQLQSPHVSVKAKTNEKLGDIGKGNAVSCTAVVCLVKSIRPKAR